MTTDPDPFEQGEEAARKGLPAEANPYQDGSEHHSLWAAGHESIAGDSEARDSGDD
jgi:hypothetical protein